MNTIKKIAYSPSERPKYVDGYDWEEGLSDEKEEHLYNATFELWPIGEVALEKIFFLKEIEYGMLQPKEKPKCAVYFYQHQLGKVIILDEVIDVTVKDLKKYKMDNYS
jgi:hypothetical protein